MSQKESHPSATVVNLSTHPLTEEQKEQLQNEVYIEELIAYPVHFDATEKLQPQIERIIKGIDLTLEEWSSKQIYLVLPGIAPGAPALLSYVHGLRGGFPKVIWIYQDPEDPTHYVVAQSVNLQKLRDIARKIRARPE